MPTAAELLGPEPAPRKIAAPPPAKPTAADLLGPEPVTAASLLDAPAAAPRKPGFVDAVKDSFGGDLAHEYGQRSTEAFDTLADNFKRPLDKKKGVLALPARVGKTALDAATYAFSPLDAAATSVVGRPAESLTGGKLKRRDVGDLVSAALPIVGEFSAAAKARKAADIVSGSRRLIEAGKLAEPVAGAKGATGASAPLRGLKPTAMELLGPAPPSPTDGLRDAAGAVQKILAPATVGQGRDAARVVRRATAESDLLATKSAHSLIDQAKLVDQLPVEQQRALVKYMEGRSTGATLPDAKMQGAADTMRKVFDNYRGRIEQVMGPEDSPSFIRDYYSHMWKESPQVVEGRMTASRQGSGRNLKARSIPTLEEGIAAGLTPLHENPIETTVNYANNMSRFLATVDTQSTLAKQGLTKWATPGAQPKDWVPLNGIRTEKAGKTIISNGEVVGQSGGQKLFAPPDVARVYNNFISKGLEQGDLQPLFEGARKTANGMTMLKLGLSAFHGVTMANESMISEMARGFQAASKIPALAAKGDAAGALASAAKGAGAVLKAPAAPVRNYLRGDRMMKELLDVKAPDSMSAAVNDAFVRSGGRVRMDPLYRARGSGSFFNALQQGTFKRELGDTAKRIFGANPSLSDRAKGIVDLGANIIQTTSAPLFENVIPRLKQGAFASTMEDWLRAHPKATQRDIDIAATDINRSIDNRFGEMAWDNLFWHRQLKQTSQLLLLSPTWNLGTINEIGGGLVDALGPSVKGLISGEGVTTRSAYVAALAAQVAMMNAAMTYLKTGEGPKSAKDLAVYRTGGTDAASGEPERALFPGYQKDVYAFGYDFPHHIGQEIQNKLNPALKTALELSTNKDFRGLPIVPGEGAVGQEGDPGLPDYLLEAFMPISIGQFVKGDKKGSKISTAEKALAVRAAPSYLTSPERQKQFTERRNQREWARRVKADARAKAMRED